jgi:hypothetical protein
MNRYAWPVTVIIAAVIIAAGGIGAALILHRTSPPAPAAAPGAAPADSTLPSAEPATTPTPAAPATAVTVCTSPVVTCAGEMRTEPAIVAVSADGSGYVNHLTWSSWGNATAQGTGTLEVDNCEPNCAQGTDTGYPATITISDLTPYGNGEQAYADMAISAPAAPYGSYSYKNLLP